MIKLWRGDQSRQENFERLFNKYRASVLGIANDLPRDLSPIQSPYWKTIDDVVSELAKHPNKSMADSGFMGRMDPIIKPFRMKYHELLVGLDTLSSCLGSTLRIFFSHDVQWLNPNFNIVLYQWTGMERYESILKDSKLLWSSKGEQMRSHTGLWFKNPNYSRESHQEAFAQLNHDLPKYNRAILTPLQMADNLLGRGEWTPESLDALIEDIDPTVRNRFYTCAPYLSFRTDVNTDQLVSGDFAGVLKAWLFNLAINAGNKARILYKTYGPFDCQVTLKASQANDGLMVSIEQDFEGINIGQYAQLGVQMVRDGKFEGSGDLKQKLNAASNLANPQAVCTLDDAFQIAQHRYVSRGEYNDGRRPGGMGLFALQTLTNHYGCKVSAYHPKPSSSEGNFGVSIHIPTSVIETGKPLNG